MFLKEDGKCHIQIFVDEQPQEAAEVTEELYEELRRKYEGKLPNMRKDGPYIDLKWAFDVVKTL